MIKKTYKFIIITIILLVNNYSSTAQSFGYMGKRNLIGFDIGFSPNYDFRLKNTQSINTVQRPTALNRTNWKFGIKSEHILSNKQSILYGLNFSKTNCYINDVDDYIIYRGMDISDITIDIFGTINVTTFGAFIGNKYFLNNASYPIGQYFGYEVVANYNTAALDSNAIVIDTEYRKRLNIFNIKSNFMTYCLNVYMGKQYMLSDYLAIDLSMNVGVLINSPIVRNQIDFPITKEENSITIADKLSKEARTSLAYKNFINFKVAFNLVY